MRKSEDHMKVGGMNDLSPAFIHPDLLENCLTVRTVTVAAGVIVYLHMFTITASAYVYTKFPGFAV